MLSIDTDFWVLFLDRVGASSHQRLVILSFFEGHYESEGGTFAPLGVEDDVTTKLLDNLLRDVKT